MFSSQNAERFATIRSLLTQEPKGHRLWRLEELFAEWPEGEEKEIARSYIDMHLAQWNLSTEQFYDPFDDFDEPAFAHMTSGHCTRDAPPPVRRKYSLK